MYITWHEAFCLVRKAIWLVYTIMLTYRYCWHHTVNNVLHCCLWVLVAYVLQMQLRHRVLDKLRVLITSSPPPPRLYIEQVCCVCMAVSECGKPSHSNVPVNGEWHVLLRDGKYELSGAWKVQDIAKLNISCKIAGLPGRVYLALCNSELSNISYLASNPWLYEPVFRTLLVVNSIKDVLSSVEYLLFVL